MCLIIKVFPLVIFHFVVGVSKDLLVIAPLGCKGGCAVHGQFLEVIIILVIHCLGDPWLEHCSVILVW
jgi:hypothetical protein